MVAARRTASVERTSNRWQFDVQEATVRGWAPSERGACRHERGLPRQAYLHFTGALGIAAFADQANGGQLVMPDDMLRRARLSSGLSVNFFAPMILL